MASCLLCINERMGKRSIWEPEGLMKQAGALGKARVNGNTLICLLGASPRSNYNI